MQLITDPAILFFIFGIFAGLIRSNLEIPNQISKFLSLYLLMTLGLKGGTTLASSGSKQEIFILIFAGLLLAFLIPIISFLFLKKILNKFDSAAVAAAYGSVSVVTFVATTQFLDSMEIDYNPAMAAVMSLMESPAIMMAIVFATFSRTSGNVSFKKVLKEVFMDGTQLLLMGSFVIGLFMNEGGGTALKPFTSDLFKGLLSFFLLDTGLKVAKKIPELKINNSILLIYAILAPLLHATIALVIAYVFNLNLGDGTLFMLLASSASYIAVPAAIGHSIPEANPSIYVGLSLGITFPFNILVGIPLYTHLASAFLLG